MKRFPVGFLGFSLLGSSAFGHGEGGWHMGYAPMMGGGMWCFIFWAAIAIAVLILIVLALRYLGVKGTARAEKSSLEILKERYAKGEISKAEFEEIKRDLEA